jgi:CYTH domain-containing protein
MDFSMPVERRFLIASSFARLIQRESPGLSRIVEGHFQPHPDRTQFVRVERERATLILVTPDEDGTMAEEQAEVPRTHAEALIDVAAGTVAFDRIPVSLGGERRGLLDRFILPNGINILTTVTETEADGFEVPDWFGPEVTTRADFERSSLALHGAPLTDEIQVTNVGLEALLDTLEGRIPYRYRPRPTRGPAMAPGSARIHDGPSRVEPAPAEEPSPVLMQAEPEPEPAPPALEPAPAEAMPPAAEESPAEPAQRRAPALRGHIVELDDGIARLARSLAPRGSRNP